MTIYITYQCNLLATDEVKREIANKMDLANFWYDRMRDTPDIVFRFDQARVKLRSDGSAVFSAMYEVSST